ncbi:hypothetical protein JSQ81_06475 [Sporosarcina sp. Marseille-Q4063]|uniref:hypothetical protein n=1 Tax=Sporosarcina sp. Marseille-Q4063 TaxID=2810514 RepID=UPI001BAFA8F3|nr:hypothetical protein [Sporosarcina sp. Marseille-Q4063]QUW23202.1 hypothetical protein JSQ81_06475 [Sporosarcina sp. Marseille-Q4063]
MTLFVIATTLLVIATTFVILSIRFSNMLHIYGYPQLKRSNSHTHENPTIVCD